MLLIFRVENSRDTFFLLVENKKDGLFSTSFFFIQKLETEDILWNQFPSTSVVIISKWFLLQAAEVVSPRPERSFDRRKKH